MLHQESEKITHRMEENISKSFIWYENSNNSTKKKNNPTETGQRVWIDIFPKINKWRRNAWYPSLSAIKTCKSKPEWDNTSYLLEQLYKKGGYWGFPRGTMMRALVPSLPRAWVQSLVRELRSHKWVCG